MSRCKDCIHEIICDALIKTGLPWNDGKYPAEAFCMTFKNKADVVEVVRCKDCKYYIYDDGKYPYCKIMSNVREGECSYPFEDHYCSYGERRENGKS